MGSVVARTGQSRRCHRVLPGNSSLAEGLHLLPDSQGLSTASFSNKPNRCPLIAAGLREDPTPSRVNQRLKLKDMISRG